MGGLDEPELMEQVLAEGKADIIAVGRAIIADAQIDVYKRQHAPRESLTRSTMY